MHCPLEEKTSMDRHECAATQHTPGFSAAIRGGALGQGASWWAVWAG